MNLKAALDAMARTSFTGAQKEGLSRILRALCEEPKEEEETWAIGDKFDHACGEYMIASCGPTRAILVSLEDGNHWAGEGVRVADAQHITQDEFSAICGQSFGDFIRKEKP